MSVFSEAMVRGAEGWKRTCVVCFRAGELLECATCHEDTELPWWVHVGCLDRVGEDGAVRTVERLFTYRGRTRPPQQPRDRRAAQRAHYSRNRGAYNARATARKGHIRRATPAWADKSAIEAIYVECRRVSDETGVPHEVDHDLPLRGRWVCGLHVPSNLQIIPADRNRSKGNRT